MTLEACDDSDGQLQARLEGIKSVLANVSSVTEHWRAFYDMHRTPEAREALVKALSLEFRLDAMVWALQTVRIESHRAGEALGETN